MPLPDPHFYTVLQPPGVVARISVNDIPFYRRVVDHHASPSGPFNHMIVPGENVVTLELAEVPGVVPANVVSVFEFRVQREADDRYLFRAKWPELAKEYPEEQRQLPIVHVRTFEPEFETPMPIWIDAPRDFFPSDGTPEQHDTVRELHEAYRRGDADAFLGATQLKLAEHAKFYGQTPELAPAAAKQRYAELLREPWDLDPYEPEALVFEQHADNRVAYVTRRDGGPALNATHKTDPTQAWRPNLLLTRVSGRWRIFW